MDLQSTPNSPSPQLQPRINIIKYIALFLSGIAIGAITAAYFLPSKTNNPPGIVKAQDILKSDSDFISRKLVQLSYQGTLKEIKGSKRSFILEKNGKTVTINHQGGDEIVFLKARTEPNANPERINIEDLKIGDRVTIAVSIDMGSNTVSITYVIRNSTGTEPTPPSSSEGSPAASPAL